MISNWLRGFAVLLLATGVAACGGGGSFTGSSSPTTTPTPTPVPGSPNPAASLTLLISGPKLPSDGSSTVTLSALARDANNNVVQNASIVFGASSGSIKVVSSTTDVDGLATATLSTGGDPTNRTITVVATDTLSGLTASKTVQVADTALSFAGDNTLTVGDTTVVTLFLTDSGGRAIADQNVNISYDAGLTVLPSTTTVTTNTAGTAALTVTATTAGTKNITATALGATKTFSIAVAAPGASAFSFTPAASMVPAETNEPAIGVSRDLEVCLTGVAPLAGHTVTFSSNRGVFSVSGDVAQNVITAASGCASAIISSTIAGSAHVTAKIVSGPSAAAVGLASSQDIEFVATTAASLKLQADPAVVSAGGKTTITATVRDAANNLVKNKTVVFSVTSDPTSGIAPNPVSGVTNSSGQVSTIYTGGNTNSGKNDVILRAIVSDTIGTTNVSGNTNVTVASKALHVALGTGNTMSNQNVTTYKLPYVAIVTDAAGNRVANQNVSISVWSYRYRKGEHVATYTPSGAFLRWAPVYTYECGNEDLNRNGIIDASDNDLNANGKLEPGNIATIASGVITTDAQGLAAFDILYPEQYAYWLDVELEARVGVTGSEDFTRSRFTLTGVDSDFNDIKVSPPGPISPFGQGVGANGCNVDEY